MQRQPRNGAAGSGANNPEIWEVQLPPEHQLPPALLLEQGMASWTALRGGDFDAGLGVLPVDPTRRG
jgi:hypothetical protein